MFERLIWNSFRGFISVKFVQLTIKDFSTNPGFSHLLFQNAIVRRQIIPFVKQQSFSKSVMELVSVLKVFETIVPIKLSEPWDNTGLLLDAGNSKISQILMTNDLTEKVLEEAISLKADLIISYHPPLFKPFKRLGSQHWKDRIVTRSLQNNISIYSPHTACDAVAGGVNDWLIGCFDLVDVQPITKKDNSPTLYHLEFKASTETKVSDVCKPLENYGMQEMASDTGKTIKLVVSKEKLIESTAFLCAKGFAPMIVPNSPSTELTGMGRVGKLKSCLKISECIDRVKTHLNLTHIRVAFGIEHSLDSNVKTIACCAGSGSSILQEASADLFITGEMSHHDILDINHRNITVIICEHSNSERGYLKKLANDLNRKLTDVTINVSSIDRDPISIL